MDGPLGSVSRLPGILLAGVLGLTLISVICAVAVSPISRPSGPTSFPARLSTAAPAPVANFSAAINRMVQLIGFAGGGILALVWARVALSWFSNDVTKKIQAKDRARDALVGTLLFTAAVSGLVWGLARWVVTGT